MPSVRSIPFHPFADVFPLSEGEQFEALVRDIRQNGLLDEIVLHQGQILDGRNRYRACEVAGVEPRLSDYEGGDPLGFMVSKNLRRRHLTASQRAMVAAKLATLPQGRPEKSGQLAGIPTQAQAAKLLNIGERSVRRAGDVRNHGSRELQRAVERGEIRVSVASEIATWSIEDQRAILLRDSKWIVQTAKEIGAAKKARGRAERIQRNIELANVNAPLPSDRLYGVVLADPPFKNPAVEQRYPTMTVEEICAMPVSALATPDAVLFLWVPPALLAEGLRVMAAWGFRYVSQIIWDKQSPGWGRYVRQQHEILLIGTKGKPITPEPSDRPPSIVRAPRREHSRKPDEVYDIIERMYPSLPKIELFARYRRTGWAAWGNEVGTEQASEIPRLDISHEIRIAGDDQSPKQNVDGAHKSNRNEIAYETTTTDGLATPDLLN
jgi:N6-adenosine-specific RNA methylase IME4